MHHGRGRSLLSGMYHDHAPSEASARELGRDAVPVLHRLPVLPSSRAPHGSIVAPLPVVYCPECGMPAWVEWRDEVGSTAGAVAHVKVRCFARHWFLMPEDRLTGV